MSKNRTEIKDFPAEEQELTQSEAEKIRGGYLELVGIETDLANDVTQKNNTSTYGETDYP
jgi:hypothetical protein